MLAATPALAQPPAPGAAHGRSAPAAAARTATPAQPAAQQPAAPVALPDPPIPTQHAAQAGMGRCVPLIDQLSRSALAVPYNAQSQWNPAAPAEHIFQSVAGLHNAKNAPPSGVTAIIAAPVANNGCDAVTVEVYPLAGSCADVQKLIQKGGDVETSLMDVRVITDAGKRRLLLLPGFGATCVALSFNSVFGPPAAHP